MCGYRTQSAELCFQCGETQHPRVVCGGQISKHSRGAEGKSL